MGSRSFRNRLGETTNIWPGFVDVLATLLIVIIFILMIFTVSQIYLSDAISGRDKALQELKQQISELSKILQTEVIEKEEALESLSETELQISGIQKNLKKQELLSKELQIDLAEKSAEIFVQDQNILALSYQITELLEELRIVARALETYEGLDTAILRTDGLGERINKALASRINQLKLLNAKLDETNKELDLSKTNLNDKIIELNIKNENLNAINQNLGLKKGGIKEQINAIKIKNQELVNLNQNLINSQKETQETLNLLEKTNLNLALRDEELQNQINQYQSLMNDLLEINDSLGLKDATLQEQLEAIKFKNQELVNLNQDLINSQNSIKIKNQELVNLNQNLINSQNSIKIKNQELVNLNQNLINSQKETQETLNLLEKTNLNLALRDEELQNQINQYQSLMNDLLEINDSLGLKDATLQEQLEAIKFKNQELSKLNKNLINKDNTIFDLRGKIIELNNVLSISKENRLEKELEMALLKNNINNVEELRSEESKISTNQIEKMKLESSQTFKQISILSDEIEDLKNEIVTLNLALEANEEVTASRNLEIEILGERLNKALTSKIFELQKYRSEFFGKLQSLLGDRNDIKIVGDRFIFESELLFDSASSNLQEEGKEKLKEIALTLMETTTQIPTDIDWIIQVEGHTDKRPINTAQYPSNWELSTARANSVLKLLLEIGFPSKRLAAAGYGEFYPISDGESKKDFQQNRRIELKLTSR